jgi:hypothetical protein
VLYFVFSGQGYISYVSTKVLGPVESRLSGFVEIFNFSLQRLDGDSVLGFEFVDWKKLVFSI